jgi:serine protease Do
VKFGILRAGKQHEIEVTTGEWPRNQWDALDAPLKTDRPKITIPPDLGLTLAPLQPADRARLDLTTYKEGVLITTVPKNSDAWERGVQAGDVILRVQDKPVFSKGDILAAVAAERAAKRRYVLLLIWPKVRAVPGPKWIALQAGPDGD